MPTDTTNPFNARASLRLGGETAVVYRLTELARQGLADLDRLRAAGSSLERRPRL